MKVWVWGNKGDGFIRCCKKRPTKNTCDWDGEDWDGDDSEEELWGIAKVFKKVKAEPQQYEVVASLIPVKEK